MNPITKALDEITMTIPKQILEKVFVEPSHSWRNVPANNVRELIKQKVIHPRVLVDCNLIGGAELTIPLDDIPYDTVENDYTHIYRIPKSKTNGRAIVSVLDVSYGTMYQTLAFNGNGNNRGGAAMQLAASVMEAQVRPPHVNTARVTLVGENTIMVQDSVMIATNLQLRCIVEHDEFMSHLQPRSYRAFAHLVKLAVKAYIYNEYVIRMDMAELSGGMALNSFKSKIEEWADMEQQYQDYLTEKWQKIDMMNDSLKMQRFIGLLVGGSR